MNTRWKPGDTGPCLLCNHGIGLRGQVHLRAWQVWREVLGQAPRLCGRCLQCPGCGLREFALGSQAEPVRCKFCGRTWRDPAAFEQEAEVWLRGLGLTPWSDGAPEPGATGSVTLAR
jgi:hypothetical protein